MNDLEEAGGDGTWTERSDWSPPAVRSFGAPTLDLGDNQTQYDHILEAGPHGIVVVALGTGVWGCGGFDAT